ncbi:MAG: hypothetical protein FWE24_00725 [Defluviitaleaceae bacterium]|nr:hypothetical protein [Defluviitaleaceae bacterium]
MKIFIPFILFTFLFLAACSRQSVYHPEIDETLESDNDALTVIPSISAASRHTLALRADGSLWSFGAAMEDRDGNRHSLIGDGTTESRPLPVKIMEDVIFAVAGHHHSFAITKDGALWAWGSNTYGQLGDGTTENRLSPVKIMDDAVYVTMPRTVPNSHVGDGARSYVIRSDGSLFAFGHSGINDVPWAVALGDGGSENRYTPVQILENVKSVVPIYNGGFALTYDGVLWTWHGTILISNFEDGEWAQTEIEAQLYPVPIMENIASISSRGEFAITKNGELWSLGQEPSYIMDNIIYAKGLNGANFAITTDNTLYAWGINRLPSHWQPYVVLGDGTTTDRDEPVKIMENVASITLMGHTAYVITLDGELWGWGNGGSLILIGDGSIFTISEDTEYMHMWEYAYENGFPNGIRWLLDDDGGTGLRLSPVKILENVVSVTPTYFMFDHGWIRGFRTFALTADGCVYAWGANDVWSQGFSLLGDGTTELHLCPVRIIE